MSNPLDEARAAYKAASKYRQNTPVLGGALLLVLDEPEDMAGYSPFVMQAAGVEPEPEKDAEFLAASMVDVTGPDGDPVTGEDGEPLNPQQIASAIAGAPVTNDVQVIYTLFSAGDPPKLARYQLANAAFVHRTLLTTGVREAVEEAPEI